MFKNTINPIFASFILISLSGCVAAGSLVGAAASGVLMQRTVAKQSEVKPPKYIDISQEGRIITASFEIKGFLVGHKKAAQMRGFQSWATAAVVREAPKRGCVNIINAFSANQGTTGSATIGSTKVGSSIKFKCLDKETIMSEQDLLADKMVIYKEQIEHINQNPDMIRYSSGDKVNE